MKEPVVQLFVRVDAMKYVVAAIGFVVVWAVVAIACGFILETWFQPWHDYLGVSAYLPGIILGILAGVQTWRSSLRVADKQRVQNRKMD
jgi:hypothetical protein